MKEYTQYKLDVIRSPEDRRDFIAESIYPVKAVFPATLDLRPDLKPVRDQGSQGSCVAQTGACMKEWQEKYDISKFSDYMSPQFIYNLRSNQDSSGMYPRNLMSILKNIGSVPEVDYPYYTKNPITDKLRQEASEFKIQSYAQINTIEAMKAALYTNGPVSISVPVYNYGMRLWKPTDTLNELLGGHAMTVVGYNDKGFIIRNSWGDDWGDNGYTIFPYEDWGLHWEAWTTIDENSSNPKPISKWKLWWFNFTKWISANKGTLIYYVLGGIFAVYVVVDLLKKYVF